MPSRSIIGSISFCIVVVAGYILVPLPAAVITAFLTLLIAPPVSKISYLAPRNWSGAEHYRAGRTADKNVWAYSHTLFVYLANFRKCAVNAGVISGAQDRDGSAGSAAGNLCAV